MDGRKREDDRQKPRLRVHLYFVTRELADGVTDIFAPDGLIARRNGPWARLKLSFLDHYGPVALKATTRKKTRVYVDLFAGPGVNALTGSGSGQFIDGSPLRALELRTQDDASLTFTDAFYVNYEEEDDLALRQRVAARLRDGRSKVEETRIRFLRGRADVVLPSILKAIHPDAYIFVFADPESPSQLPWRAVEALRKYGGHRSVDLYMLFPCDMGLNRMLGYTRDAIEANGAATSLFYGGEEWRACLAHRRSNALRADFNRCLETTYLNKLRTIWTNADTICEVAREDGQRLYKMFFASDHPAAADIGRWAKTIVRTERSDQMGLDL
jgi:three-Cys-motif partner protein